MISCEKDGPYIGFSHCPVCSAKYATEMGQAIRKLETALAAMTAERDELRESQALELAETLQLMHLIGLCTSEDFGTLRATEAIAERFNAMKKERDALEVALCALTAAASEQQHTLGSLGWHTSQTCDKCHHRHEVDVGLHWSVAGARLYQFDRIEAALIDANKAIEGKPFGELAKRTEELVQAAVHACTVGHSTGCKCLCCKVVAMAETFARAAVEGER